MAGQLRRLWVLNAGLSTVVLAACGSGAPVVEPASTTSTTTSTTTVVAAPAPESPATHEVKWVDLAVGDCIAEVPAVDLGAVTATIVDCATSHQAEVYLLAPIAVNAAVTDVASRECAAGLSPYTDRPTGGAFTVTYLIDSRQDRTSDNPLPSTVICLLQAADGRALTGSARR
jgi:hypothetical protein